MGFLGYISEHCPPGCGNASIKWHLSFNNPASKTVKSPTGPAPIISISVSIISFLFVNHKSKIYSRFNPMIFVNSLMFVIDVTENYTKEYDYFFEPTLF